ncbi:MAG: glycosyltransferase family 9 protein [Candidatus Eremiobacteraeota bacterium]|nr:glycosyltransferase family 9 protein [Candidatus Eremiobacteraeota bacterium]
MSSAAVVICAGGGIGDSLLASLCARALHKKFARVDALTLPGHRDALEHVPDIDAVLVDDGDSVTPIADRLRERRYDAAVVTWATRRTAQIPFLARIPVRVGQAQRLYSRLFTHRVVVRSERGDVMSHWSQILLDYPRAIGCDTDDPYPRFETTPADEQAADEMVARRGLRSPFGIVHVTCAATARRPYWPLEGWKALIETLQARFPERILISGSPSDVAIGESLAEATGATSLAGQTSIGAFASIAKRSSFFIVMHSGPMHVAAAVGTPTVGIFPLQCDFPDRWAPLGRHVSVVRASFRCRRRERIETCPDYLCIANLDVPRVLAALKSLRAAAA